MIGVKVGGTWLHGLGPVGDLKWSTAYTSTGGGLLTMSFGLHLPRGFTHPALRQGSLAELFVGGMRRGSGLLAEPDRDNWTFTVDGLFREAEHYAAVTSLFVPSTKLSVIVPAAIARGLPWVDPGGLSSTSVSTASETAANLNTVADVINEYCRINGKWWRIDAAGVLRIEDLPTTLMWSLTPGVPGMATADDDYASRQIGTYTDSTTHGPLTVTAVDTAAANRWGVRETLTDLTDLGEITAAAATAALTATLVAGTARPAYTQGVEVTADQLTTPGGTPAYLPFVRGGHMLRHHGLLDSDGGLAFGKTLDWVIGGTDYVAGAKSITLTPVGLAPRTVGAVNQAQMQAAKVGFK